MPSMFRRVFPGPWGRPDLKTHPINSGHIAFKYRIKVSEAAAHGILWSSRCIKAPSWVIMALSRVIRALSRAKFVASLGTSLPNLYQT